MNRDVFKLGLSTVALSAYILIDDLTSSGTRDTDLETVIRMWNATQSELDAALKELDDRQMVTLIGDLVYLRPETDWLGG